MSSRMRYFLNKLPDFVAGSRVDLDKAHWKDCVLAKLDPIIKGQPPTFKGCDGGLYVGCSGVAYMFYYLSTLETFSQQKQDLLTRARNYIDVSLSYTESKQNRDPPAAFLLGSGGVYAVGSLIYAAIGEDSKSEELNKSYLALSSACQPVNYLPNGSDELFVGRAGYICGAVLLNRKFGQVISKEAIEKVCKSVLHSGREYSKRFRSPSPLMYAYYDTEYLGAAHGLSSILQMLLSVPDCLTSDPTMLQDVRRAVDFMLGLQQPSGNIAPAMDEVMGSSKRRPPEQELVHWCHGGPGVVYLFARAFLLWKEDKYLEACLRCGELTWQYGLLKKGPGICHGIAGSGYVFLLLYRLTADEKHLHRAVKFAEFLYSDEFQKGARSPDCPYSLYEGLAGTVCFLADLCDPQKAEFPFFNVF